MNTLRIATQLKGKLAEPSRRFLESLGLKFQVGERTYITSCSNVAIEVIFLRDDDIPEYVERGIADLGIVGENVLFEKKSQVQIFSFLGFGQCSLVLAVPKTCDFRNVFDLRNRRIATTYPNLLRRYLGNLEIEAKIIELKGSVEIAPRLNLADAICDLTETGRTLRENGLKPLTTLLESQAVLVRSPFLNEKITPDIEKLFLCTL